MKKYVFFVVMAAVAIAAFAAGLKDFSLFAPKQ